MAIKSFKMGPGTLTLGADQDVSAQVTACTVAASESVDSEDDVDVLSGEVLEGEDNVSLDWTISGSFLQDLSVAGLVDYTWTNASTVVDFEFVPSTAQGRTVTGQCRLIPVSVGGDVKARATSDFDWAVIGTPALGSVA